MRTIGVLSPADTRDDLIERLERALTVHHGRRGGESETRVELDHLLPSPAGGGNAPARWRLATTTARLYPPPVNGEPMKAWHMADGTEGSKASGRATFAPTTGWPPSSHGTYEQGSRSW